MSNPTATTWINTIEEDEAADSFQPVPANGRPTISAVDKVKACFGERTPATFIPNTKTNQGHVRQNGASSSTTKSSGAAFKEAIHGALPKAKPAHTVSIIDRLLNKDLDENPSVAQYPEPSKTDIEASIPSDKEGREFFIAKLLEIGGAALIVEFSAKNSDKPSDAGSVDKRIWNGLTKRTGAPIIAHAVGAFMGPRTKEDVAKEHIVDAQKKASNLVRYITNIPAGSTETIMSRLLDLVIYRRDDIIITARDAFNMKVDVLYPVSN